MRHVQDIVFDQASQKVYLDVTEGRPTSVTSATVYLWDVSDDDTAESAIGSPSVETGPATTVDAASGYGQSDPKILYVAATTDAVVGRTYLATTADGARDWFEVAEIDSGNYLLAKHPLHNAYASADTVQSTRIQATVDSTWIADEGNLTTDDVGSNPMYRIRWVYVVNGVTYAADSYFNVVRYAARHGVLPQDVEAEAPGWLDSLPTDHRQDQGRRLIDTAHRKVKLDLRKIDLSASSVAESQVIDEFTVLKALELGAWADARRGGDLSIAQAFTKRYMDAFDALVRIVSRVPVRDSTGAATAVVAPGLTRR